MNKMFYSIFLPMFFFMTFSLSAWGRQEKTPGGDSADAKHQTTQSMIRVTGVVRLVGNSPFTELVITDSDFDWYIAKKDESKLHDLQHQTVTVEGEKTVTELTFGNGLPAGERRELKKIKIIADVEHQP